jgi:hypothetical protein
LGRIPNEPDFQSTFVENDVYAIKVTTRQIRKDASIKSIEAYTIDKNLRISINSFPHDSIWYEPDTSRFTLHEVYFDLIGIKSGEYQVELYVNSSGYS